MAMACALRLLLLLLLRLLADASSGGASSGGASGGGASGGGASSSGGGGGASALPCTIARIDAAALSASDFLAAHRHRAPLLIGGMTAGWRASSRWTWDFLLGPEASTGSAVNVGTGASIAASGLASARPTLQSFVQESVLRLETPAGPDGRSSGGGSPDEPGNPRYVFDGEFFTSTREHLQQDYHIPIEYFPFQINQANVTFFAGRKGSGLGFHKHGEAINALIRGRKRWLIYR